MLHPIHRITEVRGTSVSIIEVGRAVGAASVHTGVNGADIPVGAIASVVVDVDTTRLKVAEIVCAGVGVRALLETATHAGTPLTLVTHGAHKTIVTIGRIWSELTAGTGSTRVVGAGIVIVAKELLAADTLAQ